MAGRDRWARRDMKEIFQRIFLGLSTILCLGLFLCYAFQWDHVTAVTVLPPWAWLIGGWVMTFLGWRRSCKWLFISVAFLWLLFFFIFADEPSGLLRLVRSPAGNWEQARQQGKGIRVIYGGRGWCNTIVNEIPFARIDQIWVSDDFQVHSLRVVKTMHSDHRMVICDLIVRP